MYIIRDMSYSTPEKPESLDPEPFYPTPSNSSIQKQPPNGGCH